MQQESCSPSKLAAFYVELRTAKFKSHLVNLNRSFQRDIKEPLHFFEEVYKEGNLSLLKLDQLGEEIETAFKEEFPRHPLPPKFHQQRILVEYVGINHGSDVLLSIRLFMKGVKQDNGQFIPSHRSTPVLMYQYPKEYFGRHDDKTDLGSTLETDDGGSCASTMTQSSVQCTEPAYTATDDTQTSNQPTIMSKL